MRKIIVGAAAPFLLTLSSMANAAPAPETVPSWRVSEATGQVQLLENGQARAARKGALLSSGSVIATAANARAVIVRGKEFVVISPSTRIRVPLAEESRGGLMQMITEFGTSLFKIEKKSTPHFGVQTPYLAAVVKGTTFTVSVGPEGGTVQVTEGAVEVSTLDGGAADLVRPGSIASIGAGDLHQLTIQGDVSKVIRSDAASAGTVTTPATTATAYSGPAAEPLVVTGAVLEETQSLSDLTGGLLEGSSPAEIVLAELSTAARDAGAAPSLPSAAAPAPSGDTATPPPASGDSAPPAAGTGGASTSPGSDANASPPATPPTGGSDSSAPIAAPPAAETSTPAPGGNASQPGNGGDADKPGKSDDAAKPGKGDDADKPGKSDDAAKPGKSDDADKPGKSDDADKPGKSDDADKPGKSDDAAKPGKADDAAKPGKADDVQPGKNDDAAKPGKADDAQPGKGDDADKPGKADDAQPGKSDDADKPGKADDAQPGKNDDAAKPGKADDAQPGKSDDAGNPAKGDDAAKPGKDDDAAKPGKNEDAGKPGNGG